MGLQRLIARGRNEERVLHGVRMPYTLLKFCVYTHTHKILCFYIYVYTHNTYFTGHSRMIRRHLKSHGELCVFIWQVVCHVKIYGLKIP